ncbi:MAG: hypothetical protein LKJ25_09715 [Clostridia bacterium]|nr:hypothetical protein [Clostridia bacterium]
MLTVVVSKKIKGSSIIRDEAEKLGYRVFYHENEKVPLNYDELGCDVLVQLDMLRHNDLNGFRNLKLVCTSMVGTDVQPIDELKKRGILYTNARGIFDIPISEFVTMRILEMYKRVRTFEDEQREHTWKKRFDLYELYGRSAAIIGTGGIGKETAKRLSAFGVACIGFSKTGRQKENFKSCFPIENLEFKIGDFDIIVLCVPLEKNTYHLFDRDMFNKIKSGAVLINVGRGALLDETALYESLSSGNLFGAAGDVFEKEPLNPKSPLWELENFWYSPHNSFNSEANNERMAKMIVGNLKSFKDGSPLHNQI